MSQSVRRTYQPSFEHLEQRAAPSTLGTGLSGIAHRSFVEVGHHRQHHPEHHQVIEVHHHFRQHQVDHPEIHHHHKMNDHPGEAQTQNDNGQHGEAGAHA